MDFEKALLTVDTNFESILEIIKTQRTPEEIGATRNLLLTINLIIEYYLNREDNSLKIPIVYFPLCNQSSQEIAEEFVCLKLGLYTSKVWKNYICKKLDHKAFNVPADVKTKAQFNQALDNHKYEKKLSQILSNSLDQDYGYGKSLIYSEYLYKCFTECQTAKRESNRNTVNKYWYLRHAVTSFDKLKKDFCNLGFVGKNREEDYNDIIKNGEKINIENIVIFPMKTADGRYSNYCEDAFQKPFLDDFIDSGCGLRNVFFFCFSRKPYRLRRLIDVKQRMQERLQVHDDESFEFITFTYNESLKLNNRKSYKYSRILLGKEENDMQKDYENLFDDITVGLDRYVSRRNEMSLCIDDSSCAAYKNHLIDDTEADDVIIDEIFKTNKNLWNAEADIKVKHFVYHDDIFVVLGNDISETLKKKFHNLLIYQYEATSVKFGTFGDLRGYNDNGKYANEINQKKIIVMSFRNDYSESIFHKYPNSFDPFCVNQDQKILEISNYFFLRQYYDWGKYNYIKSLKKILKSDFRTEEMRPKLVEYKRPINKLPEDTRDEELDRNTTRFVKPISIKFSNNKSHSYSKSEWMLYKFSENMGIAPLSDLMDLYDSQTDILLQPLAPLVKVVLKNRVDSEKEKDNRSEKLFKEQPSYELSEEEINSDVQLWKILLSKRVQKTSEKQVYNEIMSQFDDRYIVSFHSFLRWMEPDYGIPRARKMQKYLIENYLGIRPPYINLVRRIKERTKSDTESITASIRHFLNIALLTQNYTNVFNGLSDETMDLLDIAKPEDIKNIVSEVNKIIKLEPIKSINNDN